MTGLMRLVPRQAQWSIRSASYAPASSSISSASAMATSSRLSLSSSQTRRAMHASPALDPVDPAASSTMDGAATQAQVASEETLDSAVAAIAAQQDANFVHVKMSYLHPSTKDPAKTPRLGDLKLGRIRAEPHFVPLSSYVFAMQPRRDVLHSAVVYYLDGLRQGTASTKTRGEVAFSGRKLMPQKGTGKARRGTRGSPLLRKGGVAHGPKPRDFSTRLNRRVREMALRSALSLRWQTGNLHIVKNFFWQAPPQSCRPLNLLLKTKGWDDALFLTAPRSPQPGQGMGRTGKPSAVDPVYAQDVIDAHSLDIQNFAIACANIPRTEIVKLNDLTTELHENPKKPNDRKRPGELHAYEVLARRKLICDLGAIEWLEEKLGGALFHEDELSLSSLSFDDVEGNTSAGTTIPVEEIAEEEIQAEAEVESQEDQNLNAAEDKAIREETERVLKDVPADK